MPSRKNRTPSKCREWERDRRNRFNEACIQLATLVVANETDGSSSSNAPQNLAKVEIVQRAITLIKNLVYSKSQLDSRLLAVEAEISTYKKVKTSSKDVHVQVNRPVQITSKVKKPKKILWMEKTRREKLVESNTASKVDVISSCIAPKPKLPKLLPKSKQAPDKAVVIMPSPCFMPHQATILPPTPTFVVLEPFMQASRSLMPIMPRVVSDITKTTMVNNLPIAAFSFPLSISKSKKNKVNEKTNNKNKNDAQKRQLNIKKKNKKIHCKSIDKVSITEEKENTLPKEKIKDHELKTTPKETTNSKEQTDKINLTLSKLLSTENKSKEINNDSLLKLNDKKQNVPHSGTTITQENVNSQNHCNNTSQETTEITDMNRESENKIQNNIQIVNNSQIAEAGNKEKEDKMQSILDNTMCDSTVDGGNARLELAEELLAASPTAAFLMSFPLVSGVRADSPADDEHHSNAAGSNRAVMHKKENSSVDAAQIENLFNKCNQGQKTTCNSNIMPATSYAEKFKCNEKQTNSKDGNANQILPVTSQTINENSFLNLMPSMLSSSSVANDGIFSLDFDANFSKNTTNSSYSYVNGNNFIFKTDSFNTKNANLPMYTSNGLPMGHDYNNFGLYPCTMEKYSNNSKNKNYDLSSEDNASKISSGRLPYDFDFNLTQKPYEFTTNTSNTGNIIKDTNIFPNVTFHNTSSYNPFNAEINIPLSMNSTATLSGKKPNTKHNPFYTDTFTNLYSQPSTLWPDDLNLYGNNTVHVPKTKSQNYTSINSQFISSKYTASNPFDTKPQNYNTAITTKPSKLEVNQLVSEKNKKSPIKSHINWMTSEVRSTQSDIFENQNQPKDQSRVPFAGSMVHNAILPHIDYNIGNKKQDYTETSLFPISMSAHSNQDDVQLWPSARPIVPTEICLDPPPISLPTLVGDLALGPQERRKERSADRGRTSNNQDLNSCNNFLSVTQLMNRSNELPSARGQHIFGDSQKPAVTKTEHLFTYPNNIPDKSLMSHVDRNNVQPCYFFNDSKHLNTQFNHENQIRQKSSKGSDRIKCQKNNYSTESLLKGAKVTENFSTVKFTNPVQKYAGYASNQEGQMAQVSHFPCITEYPDNSYTSNGFYNSSACTVPTTLYTNLMSTSYTPANFTPDFMEYTPAAPADCNFTFPLFDNYKVKNQSDTFGQAKVPMDLPKITHKESSAVKHKTEYSKKENSKKYSSKRAKMSNEIEWEDSAETLHHARHPKKNTYVMSEEMPFANYSANQGPAGHVQNTVVPDLLSYSSAVPPPLAARTPINCPTNVSRTNFNLSTLFPEIAKVRQN